MIWGITIKLIDSTSLQSKKMAFSMKKSQCSLPLVVFYQPITGNISEQKKKNTLIIQYDIGRLQRLIQKNDIYDVTYRKLP